MGTLRTRRVGWLFVAGVVLSSCYVATHYAGWQYRGGRLIDHGVLSRPRYEAPFSNIPFNAPGAYTYTFSRFPGADAVVMLTTPSEPRESSIARLATQLRIRVVDQDGRTLCDGTGSPQGRGQNQLVATSSAGVTGLWHINCAQLELRTCNPCRLHISIGSVDPATPNVVLVPTVQGGGVELP